MSNVFHSTLNLGLHRDIVRSALLRDGFQCRLAMRQRPIKREPEDPKGMGVEEQVK